MKIIINGSAVVFTSTAKMADLKLVEKNKPDALCIRGGKDNEDEIFRIGTGETGSINKFGAVFNGVARDGSECATITETLDNPELSGDDLKEYVADKYGTAVAYITQIENVLAEAVDAVTAAKKAVTDIINIL